MTTIYAPRESYPEQTFYLLRPGRSMRDQLVGRGSYQVTGTCPTCKCNRSFAVWGTEQEVDARCKAQGYECDTCMPILDMGVPAHA